MRSDRISGRLWRLSHIQRVGIEEALRRLVLQPAATDASPEVDLDRLGLLVSALDRDFRFTYVNTAAAMTGGVSAEDVVGVTPFELWTQDVAERYFGDFDSVLTTERPHEFAEEVVNVSDGSIVRATLRISPLRDAVGTLRGVSIIGWAPADATASA